MIWFSAILSSICYRLGGMKEFNTKYRDICCPIIAWITVMFILNISAVWYIHLIAFLLLFFSLTTYWDKVYKNTDNFYLHGFFIGISYLSYAIVGSVGWIALISRAILLAVLMGVLNYIVNKYKIPYRDWIEELFRGAVIILTLVMLSGCS